jgi:UDP-2,3-diacylglucosamine pyrophosphatase LpxH
LRTVVLSDLHLGRASSYARTPEIIAPLLDGAERVLLLGDCIDTWYSTPSQAQDWEAGLRDICQKSGCKEVVFFRGNHDAWLKNAHDYALLDGVLYLHGQILAHSISGHGTLPEQIQALNQKHYGPERIGSRHKKLIHSMIEHLYNTVPTPLIRPIAWWPSALNRLKKFVAQVALEVGGAEKIRGVVMGHSHRFGLKKLGANSPLLFNLGGWLRNTRACAFVRDGHSVKLIQINNHQQPVRWGKTLYEAEW